MTMLACTGGKSGNNPSGGAQPGQSGGASPSGNADSTGSLPGSQRGTTTAARDSARGSGRDTTKR